MHEHRKGHSIVTGLAAAAAMIAVSSIALLWSWNKVAAGLFGAPAMQFSHALAALLLIGTLSTIAGVGFRSGRGARFRGGAGRGE